MRTLNQMNLTLYYPRTSVSSASIRVLIKHNLSSPPHLPTSKTTNDCCAMGLHREKIMSSNETISSINPATEEKIAEYSLLSPSELDTKLLKSADAYTNWRKETIQARADLIGRVGTEIRNSLEESAQLITQEMGKSIKEARAEVEKCATGCEFYAQHGPEFLQHDHIQTDASKSYVRFDPIGGVLAVMPWNFPFWQVLRFAAPTLLAGNVGLLKHASNVTGCALAIEKILLRAGVPEGVFTTLVVPSQQIAGVIARDEIRAVSLTGSDAAGRSVAEVAGKHVKKLVLELGGSDAFIVLDDADLNLAVTKAVKSRTLNAGQSCIAAKRFLVIDSVYDEFVERMTSGMQDLKVGDPLDENNDMGPLARNDLVDDLDEQVQKSISLGARLTTGGKRLERNGCFYEPTVLADVTPQMTCFNEETFGPVASVTRIKDESEAIELANSSNFGLGGSVWTQDIARAEQIAAQLDTGGVFINEFTKSDSKVPFGGVKDSGYGRELSSYGIHEFVNAKTVWVS